ncbi:c-type cytochrome [Sulfurimonas sp. MAG313]|nr:c-type cytochrome [Sulfurimonas sp. MAG313]MDF1881550.1 c-type cytochrome [Sulfurimonas sp. MAG313]
MQKIILLLWISVCIHAQGNKSFILGQSLYEKTCISCHGAKGEGNPSIHLVVKPKRLNASLLTQAQAIKMIAKGSHYWGAYSDIMPAFDVIYNDEHIEAIVQYMYSSFPTEERVKKITKELNIVITPLTKQSKK